MDVSSIATAMIDYKTNAIVGQTSMAMLDKSIDMNQQQGAAIAKMMENSVTPYLGGNIDLSV